MTDRFNALIVTLVEDVREDDAKAIMDAIALLKGVAGVTGNVADGVSDTIAQMRVRRDLVNRLWEALEKP